MLSKNFYRFTFYDHITNFVLTTVDAWISWFKKVKSSSYLSIIFFTTMLIFEIDWFLLAFLIFGRELRSLNSIF